MNTKKRIVILIAALTLAAAIAGLVMLCSRDEHQSAPAPAPDATSRGGPVAPGGQVAPGGPAAPSGPEVRINPGFQEVQ